jgi:peroxiredoxin
MRPSSPPHEIVLGNGQRVPLITLKSYAPGPLTLSSYRGARDVVLVFYRGHW